MPGYKYWMKNKNIEKLNNTLNNSIKLVLKLKVLNFHKIKERWHIEDPNEWKSFQILEKFVIGWKTRKAIINGTEK